VPVVSEDPRPYYPTTDYSSEERSWSDISTTTPYQERNIFKTFAPEGTYRELAKCRDFIFTYIPGLRNPIRAYKTHKLNPTEYSNNSNYQASLNKPYYHRVLAETEQRALEEKAPKIIQTYTKPKEEDLAPVTGQPLATLISEITFCHFDKELHFKLEDNRSIPLKVIKERNRCKSYILNIVRYTKIRYQDWLFAGGEDYGEKFFIDLWDPKALEAIEDPDKDTHPRAQLLRDWNKVKEEQKQQGPTPKRKRNHPLA
jgi:hypothetical protein